MYCNTINYVEGDEFEMKANFSRSIGEMRRASEEISAYLEDNKLKQEMNDVSFVQRRGFCNLEKFS